jgi:hypothetical protein
MSVFKNPGFGRGFFMATPCKAMHRIIPGNKQPLRACEFAG